MSGREKGGFRLFAAYIKGSPAPLGIAFIAVFVLVFFLYGAPGEAAAYAACLCAALTALVTLAGFLRYRRRHALLSRLARDAREGVRLLPAPADALERDYQAALRAAVNAWAAAVADRDARYQERVGYYTLWAHEIKTPLAALRLLLSERGPEEARAMLAELSRVERYVEMALCYLRLDAESTDYAFASCELEPLARAAVRRFAPQFIAGRLRLTLAPFGGASALTDEKWLSFALEQLLSNAVKYTPPGGEIELGVSEGPKLFVRDTGVGIAPEDLPRVCEPGFTGVNGRADKRATGLGLYLTRRALCGLGHGLIIESRPGAGTTATIDLSTRRLEGE